MGRDVGGCKLEREEEKGEEVIPGTSCARLLANMRTTYLVQSKEVRR